MPDLETQSEFNEDELPDFAIPRTVAVSALSPHEARDELSLRPQSFAQFIGQSRAKENLALFIAAAKQRKEALDHCIFSGPPGLGKTTLAYLVAKELGTQLFTVSGPALDKKGDIASILTNLSANDVLFIDEIHRVPIAVEEVLYSAMEDFRLDIVLGQGAGARTVQIDLPPFTLIGATTRAGLLSTPLRDRFGIQLNLEFYQPEELEQIVLQGARTLRTEIAPEAARELARRSRGTPRIALRLLRRVRDFAEVANTNGSSKITLLVVQDALFRLDVDARGLDSLDKRILLAIIERFSGGPVGLDTIASCIGEEPQTIEDVYEPYLLQTGFLQRTPRGRVATKQAFEHFGKAFENSLPFKDLSI